MGYVLKLCGWYPSRTDAFNGDFVQRHAISIATQCKTVVVYAQKDPLLKSGQMETVVTQKGNLFEYRFYYPVHSFFDKFWSHWYHMQALKRFLPQLLREHGRPSLVHVNIVWRAANWALYLKKIYGWPFVITENSTEYQPEAKDNIRQKDSFRKSVTRRAFQKLGLFIPVSAQLANVVQQLYGKINYSVVPNAVDIDLFYPEKKENTVFKLLHISTMGYQKNIEGIINTLQKLAETDAAFDLTMIGPASDEVRNAVNNSAALKRKTTFTGNIPYAEVASHIRQADGLFLFSRYENLPCVIMEAHCCGVPVVASAVAGIPEVIEETNGELVPSEDEDALLQALLRLIKKEKTYDSEQIATAARAKYNYEKIGQDFMAAYARAGFVI